MEQIVTAAQVREGWARRRRRARQLADRYPFAEQILTFYAALLDPQEAACLEALESSLDPRGLAAHVAERVLPKIVAVTVAEGPDALRAASAQRIEAGDLVGLIRAWLAGDRQSPVETFLARAAAGPVLEARGADIGATGREIDTASPCPQCGGGPQLAYFTDSGDALTTGPRCLLCSRCALSWVFERMTCPACREASTDKLVIYADTERFPQLRVDGCESCHRYLVTVDLRKDAEAVPVVDELAALPFELHAQERGFTKIVPNLMGIG